MRRQVSWRPAAGDLGSRRLTLRRRGCSPSGTGSGLEDDELTFILTNRTAQHCESKQRDKAVARVHEPTHANDDV